MLCHCIWSSSSFVVCFSFISYYLCICNFVSIDMVNKQYNTIQYNTMQYNCTSTARWISQLHKVIESRPSRKKLRELPVTFHSYSQGTFQKEKRLQTQVSGFHWVF